MNPVVPDVATDASVDPLAWLGEPGPAIAELAFGRARTSAEAGLVTTRHLALLPADSLDLDLDDAQQRQFGDYELLELIGEGGMGVVYRARQGSLDREVAVKLLAAGPWASREFVERFRREAQNAARMQHPNIVAIYEVGSAEELHFFSMRLVRGESLAAALRREGPFDPHRAASLMRTVAEALAYAHSLGVLHLDLKPANVLLDENGEPHVADFGLARRLDSTLALDNEEVSGTPAYMAPEQALARVQKITASTDIWGLGAILYELVTGELPFRGHDAQSTLKLVIEGELRRPRAVLPTLPLDLEAIILKCMARDVGQRYSSARALADDLGRFIEHRMVQARPLNVVQDSLRWVRREPKYAAALAAVMLSLLVGLIGTTREWQRAEINASRAESVRQFLTGVFVEASPNQNKGQPFTASQLLKKGEDQLAQIATQDPALRADLTGLIGKMYWDIGDYEHAVPLMKQAVAANADPRVPDKIKVDNLIGLADAENQQAHYDDAIGHATEAAELGKRVGGAALDEASESQRLIASIHVNRGNPGAAVPLLQEVLARDRSRLGDSQTVADSLCRLSQAFLRLSQFDAAIAAARESVAMMTALDRREESVVVAALENMGQALGQQAKYEESEAALRDGFELASKIYGDRHHLTAMTHSNLLWIVEQRGAVAEGLRQREELLRSSAGLSETHPQVVALINGYMAADHLALGHFIDAEAAARASLATWKDLEGSNDEADSFASLGHLANALRFQGRYPEAEAILRKLIALETTKEPLSSVWLAANRGSLADLLRAMHRSSEAERELRDAIAQLPAPESPARAELLAKLAEAELDMGNSTAAIASATSAVTMMRSLVPTGHVRLGTPLFALGRAQVAKGRPDLGEVALLEALAARHPPYPADDPRVLEIQVELVHAQVALGRTDEASALRASAVAELAHLSTPSAADLRARLADHRP